MKKLILIFFLFTTVSFAQKEQALHDYIKVLEQHFKIRFTYSDDTIENKTVDISAPNNESLTNIIIQLENQTGLIINKKSNRYYVITQPKITFTICGYIKDSITTAPLKNVSIKTVTHKKTFSNEQGWFSLQEILSTDSLEIGLLGYDQKIIPAVNFKSKDCPVIYLNETVNSLEEIVIRNYLTKGVLKKVDGGVLIKPQQQGTIPGSTDADVFLTTQQLPGIISPLETASGIHINGGTPDQNLVLFDNIKLYSTAHFFGAISAFNPNVINKVAIFKNAAHIKYGNHISGVIDITTLENIPKKSSYGLGFNLTSFDGYTKQKISDKIGVQFAIRRSSSDILETPTFNKLSDKVFQNTIISEGDELSKRPLINKENFSRFFDFNTKLIYKPNEKSTLTIQQIALKNSFDYQLINNEETEYRSDDLEIQNEGYGISYTNNFSKSWEIKSSLFYSNYDLEYERKKEQQAFIFGFTKKTNKVKDMTFSLESKKIFNNNWYLNLGYEYSNKNVSYSLEKEETFITDLVSNADDRTENIHAVLAEYVFKKGNTYMLSTGVRSSYLTQLNRYLFEPRILGKLRISPSIWITSSAELKQQYTSKIVEFFTEDFGLENDLWTLSNNETTPILRSVQYTGGLLFNRNNWFVNLELYHKKIKNITSLSSGFNNLEKSIFNGNATVKGLDVLLKKDWSKNLSSLISYTLSDASLNFDGFNNNQTFKSNFNISNSLYIAQQFEFNQWNFSIGWNYRSGLPFNSLVEINPNNSVIITEYNNDVLPDYSRLDASINYSFYFDAKNKIKSRIGLSFLNILNRKNVLNKTYEVILDENFIAQLNTIETTGIYFTPNLVFRVSF